MQADNPSETSGRRRRSRAGSGAPPPPKELQREIQSQSHSPPTAGAQLLASIAMEQPSTPPIRSDDNTAGSQGLSSTSTTRSRSAVTPAATSSPTASEGQGWRAGQGPREHPWTTEVFRGHPMDQDIRRLHMENEQMRDRLLKGEGRPFLRPVTSGRHSDEELALQAAYLKANKKDEEMKKMRLSGAGDAPAPPAEEEEQRAPVRRRRRRRSASGRPSSGQPAYSSTPTIATPPQRTAPRVDSTRSPSPQAIITDIITHPDPRYIQLRPPTSSSGEFDITNPAHVTARRIRSMQNPRFSHLWHARGTTPNLYDALTPHPPSGHYHHLDPPEDSITPPRGTVTELEKFLRSFCGKYRNGKPIGCRNVSGYLVVRIDPGIREWFRVYELNELAGKWVLKHSWGGIWIGLDKKKGWHKIPIEGHSGPGATSLGGRWPGVENLGTEAIREAVGRRIRFLGENYEILRMRELAERKEAWEEEQRARRHQKEEEEAREEKMKRKKEALKRRCVDIDKEGDGHKSSSSSEEDEFWKERGVRKPGKIEGEKVSRDTGEGGGQFYKAKEGGDKSDTAAPVSSRTRKASMATTRSNISISGRERSRSRSTSMSRIPTALAGGAKKLETPISTRRASRTELSPSSYKGTIVKGKVEDDHDKGKGKGKEKELVPFQRRKKSEDAPGSLVQSALAKFGKGSRVEDYRNTFSGDYSSLRGKKGG